MQICINMHKVSSFHLFILQIQSILAPSQDWPHPFLTPNPNIFNHTLICVYTCQHAKNQLILSVHSWDNSKLVQRPDWQHPFLTMANYKIFDQLLIFVNLYQHAKNEAVSSICWRRKSWLKNAAIWLAGSTLVYISRTR